VRFPPAWHLLNAPLDRGMTVHFIALDGEPIYSDQVVTGPDVGPAPRGA